MRYRCWPRIFVSLIAISVVSAISAADVDRRYWVWQRDDPLDDEEIAELAAQKVQTIYWQVGELENVGATWHWKARFDFPGSERNGIHLIPAVRLVSHEREPFSDASVADLLTRLTPIARNADELQLDYDAPDRLLPDYSATLKKIHQIARKLTITALPHWSQSDCLKVLGPSVEEFLPMLYDFEAEPVLKNGSPLPLIEPETISKLINGWRSCGKTWRAGLPVFSRLSVYDSNQKLRGQIRNWNWDELCFNRSFVESAGNLGTTNLRAGRSTSIANTPIRQGEQVIVREADRAALRDAVAAAERAGAQSVIFFRLPDSSASSGWSLRQLGHLAAKPELILKKSPDSETLELSNSGEGDLAPRFAKDAGDTGGYTLEVEAASRIFREAQPGDFSTMSAHVGQSPTTIPFATRIQFKFAELRALKKIRTGLIQLAPGADFRQARYRILEIEGGPSWKSLE